MNGNGRNPTRRNRNIGTAKAGRGQDNRFVIPASWNDSRVYWERLRDPVCVECNGFTFLVEPCTQGSAHSVTIDDVLRILSLLPHEHVAPIRIIALRQPTKKQRVLRSVWGRFAYFADFGSIEGPAVILDAQPIDDVLEFDTSMPPDVAEELERLRADGHAVSHDRQRRCWRVETNLASTRATQLFRTLPHEVGHYAHYQRDVLQACGGDPAERDRLEELYFTKPAREKEDFAHRYAREFGDRCSKARRIPFDRDVDPSRLQRLGLDPAWFGAAL